VTERFSRNEALFGAEGQAKIAATAVAIVGAGGLGSHVAQQLGYLGVRQFGLVDDDIVTDSSLNRLVGSIDTDVAAGTTKVTVAKRMIEAMNPSASVVPVELRLADDRAKAVIADVDVVFGCLDQDLPRLALTEVCARLAKPYFDLATDTEGAGDEVRYGGRVILADGSRCPVCLKALDQAEMTRDAMNPEQREAHDRIYGVRRKALEGTGPMVVSINGAVASLAVTEFICLVTGLRKPIGQLIYRGERGTVGQVRDLPEPDCYYCKGLWGTGLP
jgi:molybdopterin/thiamine biosynthesis adenylyltransferase